MKGGKPAEAKIAIGIIDDIRTVERPNPTKGMYDPILHTKKGYVKNLWEQFRPVFKTQKSKGIVSFFVPEKGDKGSNVSHYIVIEDKISILNKHREIIPVTSKKDEYVYNLDKEEEVDEKTAKNEEKKTATPGTEASTGTPDAKAAPKEDKEPETKTSSTKATPPSSSTKPHRIISIMIVKGVNPAEAKVAMGVVDNKRPGATNEKYDPLINRDGGPIKTFWKGYQTYFETKEVIGKNSFIIPKDFNYTVYLAIEKPMPGMKRNKQAIIPITDRENDYAFDLDAEKEVDPKSLKNIPATSETKKYYAKDEFVNEIIRLLTLYVIKGKTFREAFVTEDSDLKGLAGKDFAKMREYATEKGSDELLVKTVNGWMEKLWAENKNPSDSSSIADDDKKKVHDLFAKNEAETEALSHPAPKSKLKPNDEKIGEELSTKEVEEAQGLFFYNWWAFQNEEDIKLLDKDGNNPRQLRKFKEGYQEQGTKDKDVADENKKPHGERALAKYLDGGTTRTNVEFESRPPHVPAALAGYPYVGLCVAIAKRSDIERLFNGRSFPEGALSNEQQQRLYELLDKEDLRWKWDWQGKPKHQPTPEEEDANIKGYVVDNELVKSHPKLGFDLFNEKITQEQAELIIKHAKDVGIKDADVKIAVEGANEINAKTDSQGSFGEAGLPIKKTIRITAKKTKWKGKTNKTEAPIAYPEVPNSEIQLSGDYFHFIIPMHKPEGPEPKTKDFVLTCTGHSEDHLKPRSPKYGPDTIIEVKKKIKDGKIAFQAFNNPGATGGEAYLYCCITKLKEGTNRIDRENPMQGVTGIYEKGKDWDATWTVTYKLDDDEPGEFGVPKKIKRTLNKATITAKLSVPEGKPGAYRVWVFVIPKGWHLGVLADDTFNVSDLVGLQKNAYDFNYYDLLIKESAAAKKKEEKSGKEMHVSGEKEKKWTPAEARTHIKTSLETLKKEHPTVHMATDKSYEFFWTDDEEKHAFFELLNALHAIDAEEKITDRKLYDEIIRFLGAKIDYDTTKTSDAAGREKLRKELLDSWEKIKGMTTVVRKDTNPTIAQLIKIIFTLINNTGKTGDAAAIAISKT